MFPNSATQILAFPHRRRREGWMAKCGRPNQILDPWEKVYKIIVLSIYVCMSAQDFFWKRRLRRLRFFHNWYRTSIPIKRRKPDLSWWISSGVIGKIWNHDFMIWAQVQPGWKIRWDRFGIPLYFDERSSCWLFLSRGRSGKCFFDLSLWSLVG